MSTRDKLSKDNRFAVNVKSLIVDDKNRFLILKKRIVNPHSPVEKHVWELPEGRVRIEENVYNAVWREAKENTNLDVEVLFPSNVWTQVTTDFLHVMGITFFCKWLPKEHEELIEESGLKKTGGILLGDLYVDFQWHTAKEIADGHFPIWLKEEVAKWKQYSKISH